MQVLNERAFRQLIKKYKSIIFEDLSKRSEESIYLCDFLNNTTGFGGVDTCTLCRATSKKACGMMMYCDCNKCLYVYTTGEECNHGLNSITYDKLTNSCCSPKAAIEYIYERIEHMQCVYNDYLHKVIDEIETELAENEDVYQYSKSPYIIKLKRKLKCFKKKLEIINEKGL